MEEARFQHEHIHNIAFPDSMPNAPSANQATKKTYVMLYSDNEDDLASLDGNERNIEPDSVSIWLDASSLYYCEWYI